VKTGKPKYKDFNASWMILAGMIADKKVVARLAPTWPKDGMFKSDVENLIAGWAVNYYRSYRKPIKARIENSLTAWAPTAEPEQVKEAERFLARLSDSFEKAKASTDYVLDTAGTYFNEVRASKLANEVQGLVDQGNYTEVYKRLDSFRKVELGKNAPVDLLSDEAAYTSAFQEKREVLVEYPGAAGRFFGRSLERDGFIAFLAPEKRGKTWWLLDMAWRAMLGRKRVAFFQLGDLTQPQMIRRFGVRGARRPLYATKPDKPVRIPKRIEDVDGKVVVSNFVEKHFSGDLDEHEVKRAFSKVMTEKVRSKNSYLRISTHPNSTLTVAGASSLLDEWIGTGWGVPDLAVFDYADILAPPTGFRGETRDAVNENWKAMRRLSQEYHCLVVTATQANAASYTADMLDMGNFSEDKRKFAHVTGMVGINQNHDEKLEGIQRLGWLVLREDEFHVTKVVYVAGCLALANPCMVSAYL
jgi:hypothetical protein